MIKEGREGIEEGRGEGKERGGKGAYFVFVGVDSGVLGEESGDCGRGRHRGVRHSASYEASV